MRQALGWGTGLTGTLVLDAGCDDGGKYKQCWLRQDWAVWDTPRPRSAGYNWISGYISTHVSTPQALPTGMLPVRQGQVFLPTSCLCCSALAPAAVTSCSTSSVSTLQA